MQRPAGIEQRERVKRKWQQRLALAFDPPPADAQLRAGEACALDGGLHGEVEATQQIDQAVRLRLCTAMWPVNKKAAAFSAPCASATGWSSARAAASSADAVREVQWRKGQEEDREKSNLGRTWVEQRLGKRGRREWGS